MCASPWTEVTDLAADADAILVIDDDETLLARLLQRLEAEVGDHTVSIQAWMPQGDQDPRLEFDKRVTENTLLVITDYDLTTQGVTGLFGASIVSWCQARAVPVGNFSRANVTRLPREPNLFELRVSPDIGEAAAYTASVFRGFRDLRDSLSEKSDDVEGLRSPAVALAALLGRPTLEADFSLYMSRLGAANGALLEKLRGGLSDTHAADEAAKRRLLVYIVGHVLVNAI